MDIFEESWLSCDIDDHIAISTENHWISFDLKHVRKIDSTHLWNYNIDQATDSGIKEISLYYSLNQTDWIFWGKDTLPQATGLPEYAGSSGPQLNGITAQYLLLVAESNYGGTCFGLSEIQIFFDEEACTLNSARVKISRNICESEITSDVQIIPGGGIHPYSYYWSSGHSDSLIYNIDSGTYSVLIVDAMGCSTSLNFEISNEGSNLLDLNNDPIPPDIYISPDTIKSSGVVRELSEVSLIFNDAVEILNNFKVESGAELWVFREDCSEDSIFTNFSFYKSGVSKTYYMDYVGLGNDLKIEVLASHENAIDSAKNVISGLGDLNKFASGRFLSQATLGYDRKMIGEVADLGIHNWLEWQFSLPHQSYFNHLKYIERFDSEGVEFWLDFHRTWWHNILTEDDYLRDRVAFALSEIFVISSKSFLRHTAPGLTSYYDILLSNSFGNYRDLLYEITLHPAMGFYLSHINNPKSDTTLNRFPDENYAREVLQLFSIGINELNIDGTEKIDSFGATIPTYNNDDIIEFAKIFTGLGYNDQPFGIGTNRPDAAYTIEMKMHEEHHEPGEKFLLSGQIIPADQIGLKDISDAIDNIFNHPNVGPFLATRLIQRLVKSHPSPAYVQRIAEVFNDDGAGVRGNLKAVIKTILTDNEARDCIWIEDSEHGMMREPIVRLIHLLKAFEITSTSGTFYGLGEKFEKLILQAPLRAPSVFNFFQYDYSEPGVLSDANIKSPEFQIFDSYSSIGFANLVDSISLNQGILDVEEGEVVLNFSNELMASTDSENLISLLDYKLTYGNLTSSTRNILLDALSQLNGNAIDQTRMALFIVANSPEFIILK